MIEHQHDVAGVIAPPPLIYGGTLLLGLLLGTVLPTPFISAPLRWIVAFVFLALAAVFVAWPILLMTRAGTSPIPETPTTAIVTRGPYAFTRNPIYLGMAFGYAGVAIGVNSLLTLLLLIPVLFVINRGVIEREERYLERKFGDSYRQYKARVRRWL